MKIQLEHGEIKIDVLLEGIETDQARSITKKVFNTFLESIHIVNNQSLDIIETDKIESNSAGQKRIEKFIIEKPAEDQEADPTAAAPGDPGDQSEDAAPGDPAAEEDPADQTAMSAALAAYEAAEAEKKARAATFGLPGSGPAPRTRIATRLEILKDLSPTTYRRQNGRLYFQAYIVCTDCRHKQKHYIERGVPYVNCHQCGKRNAIRPAKIGNFPHVDTFGNFFIGGAFKRADEREREFQAERG